TFEPGAREDLTQGRRSSPRSTAFCARSPAAIITEGLEVFVQDVIAAITTEPCSSAYSSPSTSTRFFSSVAVWVGAGSLPSLTPSPVGGALAGNESATSLSYVPFVYSTPKVSSESMNASFAFASGTRSCGRRGPAREGSTSSRSSSTTCEYSGCSSGSCQSWFSLQYASTRAIRSALRPVRRRYSTVTSSTGK